MGCRGGASHEGLDFGDVRYEIGDSGLSILRWEFRAGPRRQGRGLIVSSFGLPEITASVGHSGKAPGSRSTHQYSIV